MKIIKPSAHIISPVDAQEALKQLEICGRTCYKSEDKMTPDSAARFVRAIVRSGHEAVLEHYSVTARFIVDRGVSHEIVRHRLAAYCQESTRYCNYSKGDFGGEITVIAPCFLSPKTGGWALWESSCRAAEASYFALLDYGCSPQEARAVLPTSVKTEVVMTANLREWRHFFQLRALGTTGRPHPQMEEVAVPLLKEFAQAIPVIFDDLAAEANGNEH